MDTSKSRTARVIFVVGLGLVACTVKLWMDANTSRAVVYSASDTSIVSSVDESESASAPAPEAGGEKSGLTTVTEAESTPACNTEPPDNAGPAGNTDLSVSSIPVYLCGAVSNPGIYHIMPGSYLYEAIDLAGGLLPEAAADNINLVFQFTCAVSVYIPSGEELKSFLAGNESSSSIFLRNGLLQGIWGGVPSDSAFVSDGSVSTGAQSTKPELININTADQNQLEALPGVGETTAKAIISYREKSGGFAKIEDIMNVAGIKEGRFEAIRELITV